MQTKMMDITEIKLSQLTYLYFTRPLAAITYGLLYTLLMVSRGRVVVNHSQVNNLAYPNFTNSYPPLSLVLTSLEKLINAYVGLSVKYIYK